jgi:hypothetical protein
MTKRDSDVAPKSERGSDEDRLSQSPRGKALGRWHPSPASASGTSPTAKLDAPEITPSYTR